jgi:hypothetical protein
MHYNMLACGVCACCSALQTSRAIIGSCPGSPCALIGGKGDKGLFLARGAVLYTAPCMRTCKLQADLEQYIRCARAHCNQLMTGWPYTI